MKNDIIGYAGDGPLDQHGAKLAMQSAAIAPAQGETSGVAAVAGWFGEAQRIIAYRIGVWRARREKPETLPGMTEAEVKAYNLGRQREAEAMIDLLSAINRGEDTTWAATSSPNNLDETRPRAKDGC